MTHGHSYHVSMGVVRLREEAKRRKADIVMFGHTHKPYVDTEGDLTIINPGSLSYPRQEGRRASYIVMEIDADQKVSFEVKFL